MYKNLQKRINLNPYFKYFFDEVFDEKCFEQVSLSNLVTIINDADYIFRRVSKGDLTDLFYKNLYKAEEMLINRLSNEKSAYIMCSKKNGIPFLSPYGVFEDHILSVCVNKKSAVLQREKLISDGFFCLTVKEDDLKNYISKMIEIFGILSIDIYNEKDESVHICLPDLFIYFQGDNEAQKRKELARILVIFNEMHLVSGKAEYTFETSLREKTIKKLGYLIDNTSLFVPVDKETKISFPTIETNEHNKQIPVFTDYYLAKEMYPEEEYLITPVLIKWLQNISGAPSFSINPNFHDFIIKMKENTAEKHNNKQ